MIQRRIQPARAIIAAEPGRSRHVPAKAGYGLRHPAPAPQGGCAMPATVTPAATPQHMPADVPEDQDDHHRRSALGAGRGVARFPREARRPGARRSPVSGDLLGSRDRYLQRSAAAAFLPARRRAVDRRPGGRLGLLRTRAPARAEPRFELVAFPRSVARAQPRAARHIDLRARGAVHRAGCSPRT